MHTTGIMNKDIKIAKLTPRQIKKLKEYEKKMGLILIAYKEDKNEVSR